MKRSLIILVVGIIVILITLQCIDASTYNVGDALNWIEPPIVTTYSIWASTHIFVKGDLLVFKFNSGIHNVVEVTKEAYKTCNTNSTPILLHANSPTTISLDKIGKRYFISTLNNDCQNGLQLAITILSRLPPPPPPRQAPAPSPLTASTFNISAPPLSNVGPNDVVVAPRPSYSSATSSFGHFSLFSTTIFVLFIFGLFC